MKTACLTLCGFMAGLHFVSAQITLLYQEDWGSTNGGANVTALTGVGWTQVLSPDFYSGIYQYNGAMDDTTGAGLPANSMWFGDNDAGPDLAMFYTTNGAGGGTYGDSAFTSIDPALYIALGFSVYAQWHYDGGALQGWFAVQAGGAWYVSTNHPIIPNQTGDGFHRTDMTYSPAATNWNHLTAGSSVAIGGPAAAALSGPITGIGLVAASTGGWWNVSAFQLEGVSTGALPPLSMALTTGTNQVHLAWPGSSSNLTLFSTSSLAQPNWQPLANVPSSGSGKLFVNLPATNPARQFFRLGLTPAGLLRASGTNIVNAGGQVVRLRGVNLGAWLFMEKWMCPLDSGNLADTYGAITNLDSRFGVAAEQSLIHGYQTNWITTGDLDNIANGGFNCVQVPVWWGNFYSITNTTSSGWRPDAFTVLDWLVTNCAACGIYVVMDLHGVVGSQNSAGEYWTNSLDQSQTAYLWAQIAARYNGNPAVAGYDLINEPSGSPGTAAVWAAYAGLYTAIRAADASHMIIAEGTFGSWDWDMLPNPSVYGWTNVVYEMHEYQWNGSAAQVQAGSDNQVKDFQNHLSWNVPGYIGEWNDLGTGVGVCDYSINDYDRAGLNWTMWAYKAIHGSVPDSWGWYDPASSTFPPTPNLETDSFQTIANDWQQWRTANTFSVNPSDGL